MDFDVKNVTVNEHQLFNIPDFIADCERTHPEVQRSGVMKIRLESSIMGTGTSLEYFTNFDEERLKNAQKQYVVGINHCPNLYGSRSYGLEESDEGDEHAPPCRAQDVSNFISSVRDTRNFASSITSSDEDVINKYFMEVLPKRAISNHTMQHSKKSVVKQGVKDAASVLKFSKGFLTLPLHQRQKMINSSLQRDARTKAEECSCPGCFEDDVLCDADKGVMYGSGMEVTAGDAIRMTKHFGLYCLTATTFLRFLPYHYPGITTPYLFFGGPESFFAAHNEDYSMYSFNYLHFGEDKIWFVVAPEDARRLRQELALCTPNINHSTCENLLGHKYFLITPQWLQERGIPFKVVVQKAGEGVIVCPNAVHFGFNKGFNVAEACNFATKTWVPYGIVAPKCRCIGTEAHLDIERIVAAIRPDLLDDYWNQTIPKIPKEEDPYFYKSILKTNGVESMRSTVLDTPSSSGCSSAMKHESDLQELELANNDDSTNLPVLPAAPEGRRHLQCPKPSCSTKFQYGKRQRMIAHVQKCHANDRDIMKYEAVLQELFQPRNKTRRRTCDLCGNEVAGRAAQLKRHQMSSNCSKRV